jgi:SAM-dependent methyltransferase
VDWHEVWERKGREEVERYDLQTLLELDGYDGGAGKLRADDYLAVPRLVVEKLQPRPGMRLLDVGCGAGALLWSLRGRGLELFGVDYSAALVEHARRAVPEATLAVAEADDLPFTADAIVCCGVFHYFPDLDYAATVVAAFRRAATVALILDVPDLATRAEALEARAAAGSKPGDHLYFPRSFFGDAEVWTHELPGYANAPFRFDVLLR